VAASTSPKRAKGITKIPAMIRIVRLRRLGRGPDRDIIGER
jgi:hypothetical protein